MGFDPTPDFYRVQVHVRDNMYIEADGDAETAVAIQSSLRSILNDFLGCLGQSKVDESEDKYNIVCFHFITCPYDLKRVCA